jgi:hypothetical protein
MKDAWRPPKGWRRRECSATLVIDVTTALNTSSLSARAAEKQASRARDAAAVASGMKAVTDLRRENEAFTFARPAVSIGFARSFSR